jgi:hypothetical protein
MDAPLDPPTRVTSISSTSITHAEAAERLSEFVEAYTERARRQGGDTTISTHLSKVHANLTNGYDSSKG